PRGVDPQLGVLHLSLEGARMRGQLLAAAALFEPVQGHQRRCRHHRHSSRCTTGHCGNFQQTPLTSSARTETSKHGISLSAITSEPCRRSTLVLRSSPEFRDPWWDTDTLTGWKLQF